MHKFIKSFLSNYDSANKYYKYLNKKTKTDDIDAYFINSFHIIDGYKKEIKKNEKELSKKLNSSPIYNELKQIVIKYNYSINYQKLLSELKDKYIYDDLELIIISLVMIYTEKLNISCKELIKRNNLKDSIINKMKNNNNFSTFNLKDYETVYIIDQELRKKNSDFKKFNTLLEKNNIVLKDIISEINRKKILNSLIINNIYDSLEEIININMEDMINKLSECEKILNKDEFYANMSIDSKNIYRSRISETSKNEGLLESELVNNFIHKKEHIGFNLFSSKDAIMSVKKPLFKMNYNNGIISSVKTMVVVPYLVTSSKDIRIIYKKLEMLYLSNDSSDNIYFTLICNVGDSNKKVLNNDKKISAMGVKYSEKLNKKYNKNIFGFVSIKRIFDANSKKYIGYRNNNDLLIDFNKLLLNDLNKNEEKRYFLSNTLKNIDVKIDYIVSIGMDTSIVFDGIKELISYISHPFNRAILNNEKSKVEYGFGMIKPRTNNKKNLFENSIYDIGIVSQLPVINANNLRCGYVDGIEIAKKTIENDYSYKIDSKEKKEILGVAKRLWKYYSENLTSENNYLIPNNYQEKRKEKFEYKTTPTDIGYSLISVICAYELGFIEIDDSIDYLENIIEVVNSLDKHNGHLYNCYNTKTKEVIYPRIVSTNSSANLVSSLILTKEFLMDKDKKLVKLCDELINSMNFSFLYDNGLFSIGYLKDENRLLEECFNDVSLVSFISIVKQDISYKHWSLLNKSISTIKDINSNIYELLLFTNNYSNTLINTLYNDVYNEQKKYLKTVSRRLPWGIGYSYYNELDEYDNYKYKKFSITNNDRVVISPYSSLMALELFPKDGYKNIVRFKQLNLLFKYGFYDAYDYNSNNTIKACSAKHQGMSLMGITNYLKKSVLKTYFYNNINVEIYDYLLKDKINNSSVSKKINIKESIPKRYSFRDTSTINVLSNTKYSIVMDNRGNSYSRYNMLDITRNKKFYKPSGLFIYIKDVDTNKIWSNRYTTRVLPKMYETEFFNNLTRYIRYDENFTTITDVVVCEEDNLEIRKITFINNGNTTKKLELTAYIEPFSDNEDIQAIIDEESKAYIAIKNNVCIFNRILIDEDEYLTSKNRIKLVPNSKKEAYLLCGYGRNMNAIKGIIKKYNNKIVISDSFKMSKFINNVKFANYSEEEINTYNSMINYLCQKDSILISDDIKEKLEENTLTNKSLLKFNVNGDKPIILVSITNIKNISFIYELLKGYLYFKNKNVLVDLLIINGIKDKDAEQLNKLVSNYKYQIYNEYDLDDDTGIIKVIDKHMITYKERMLLEIYAMMMFNANGKDFKNEINSYIENHKIVKYNDVSQDKNSSVDNNQYMIGNDELRSVIKSNGSGYTYLNNFMITSEKLLNDRSEGIKIDNRIFNPEKCESRSNYIVFKNEIDGYENELIEFIPNNENVKVFLYRVTNKKEVMRSLNTSLFISPILGVDDYTNILLNEFKKGENYLSLKNSCSDNYNDVVVFLSSSEKIDYVSYDKPLLKEIGTNIMLHPLETKEIVFTIGCAKGDLATLTLIYKYKKLDLVKKELDLLEKNNN